MPRACTSCQRKYTKTDWKFCPDCGNQLPPNRVFNGPPKSIRCFLVVDFMKYIDPLISLNGNKWLCDQLKVDESRIRIIRKQKVIKEETADRFLSRLGLTGILNELPVVDWYGKPILSQSPPSHFFED